MGPPGTGKTQTIAAAMELHLKAGNRSLLLSHANTAVDGAFKRLAKTLKETDIYQDGRMIRLGACDEALINEFPLISLENVVKEKTKIMQGEMAKLQDSLEEGQQRCNILNQASEALEDERREEEKYFQISDCVKQNEKTTSKVHSQLEDARKQLFLIRQEQKRAKNSWLKRTFGKNLEQLVQEVEKIEEKIIFFESQMHETAKKRKCAIEQKAHCFNMLQEKQKSSIALLSQLGISKEELKVYIKDANKEVKQLEAAARQLEGKIKGAKKQILQDAVIVGTTLTKAYLSDELWNKSFGCVFVDEVSMAPLPQLFLALSLANKQCTLIGDFLQLPPIKSNIEKEKDIGGLAAKWLDQSIFQVTELDSVSACTSSPYVSLLKTQYRMNPIIAGVVNELFYGGILENGERTGEQVYFDSWSEDRSLVLLDTSAARPLAINNQGTVNFYHAILATHLTVSYLAEDLDITVGVATQYRRQASIIREMVKGQCEKKGIHADRVSINTIHSFQGGECDIIIYDSVESQGSANKPWLLQERNPDIEKLLNVVITRAKKKFVLLANKTYCYATFGENEPFQKVLNMVEREGNIVGSITVDPYFKDVDDSMLEAVVAAHAKMGRRYNENSFWDCFLTDVEAARSRIIIFCPFLAQRRINKLKEYLKEAALRKVEIILITKAVEEHSASYQGVVIKILRELGQYPVKVILSKSMHHKIVLIDDHIVWEGSMNVLSTYHSGEQMVRVENKVVVKDLASCVGLSKLMQSPDTTLPG